MHARRNKIKGNIGHNYSLFAQYVMSTKSHKSVSLGSVINHLPGDHAMQLGIPMFESLKTSDLLSIFLKEGQDTELLRKDGATGSIK